MLPTLDQIQAAVLQARLASSNEVKMQLAIAERLTAAGIAHVREMRIEDAGRIDFAVEIEGGTLGIECKTHTTPMELARQLHKYGQSGKFCAFVVITSKPVQLPITHIALRGNMLPITVWTTPTL